MDARPGTEVDDQVGAPHEFIVVLGPRPACFPCREA